VGKLRATIEDALAKAGIATSGWVLAAAVVETDGTETLYVETTEEMPSWVRTGMLDEALDADLWEDEQEPSVDEGDQL
jgi:hypothetical protein